MNCQHCKPASLQHFTSMSTTLLASRSQRHHKVRNIIALACIQNHDSSRAFQTTTSSHSTKPRHRHVHLRLWHHHVQLNHNIVTCISDHDIITFNQTTTSSRASQTMTSSPWCHHHRCRSPGLGAWGLLTSLFQKRTWICSYPRTWTSKTQRMKRNAFCFCYTKYNSVVQKLEKAASSGVGLLRTQKLRSSLLRPRSYQRLRV